MSDLFDAIKSRFDTDNQAARTCLQMFEGRTGDRLKVALPAVVVLIRDRAQLGGFTRDMDTAVVEMQLYHRTGNQAGVDAMRRDLERLFDDCRIDHAELQVANMTRVGGDDPRIADPTGLYQGSLTYECTTVKTRKEPLVRSA